MKAFKNIFNVIVSNITTIISGIVVSFLLPKIISVSDYGFYKIFTLYFNYLGVLSFGIIDGIVLKYGEKDYEDLDRKRFRSYFAWYSLLNIVFTFVILMVALFIEDLDYKFLILLLGVNLLPANVTGYFQQISQITQRFKEYSTRKILQSVSNIILVLMMLVLYRSNIVAVTYRVYLICLFVVNLLLSIWYMMTYRDIICGKKEQLITTFMEIISIVRLGFPLLLSNLCSTLLLSLDRQFVSMLFGTEDYATYAFAYSILSLITVATSAISVVIYPIFKRTDTSTLMGNYRYINFILLVFLYGVMLMYFPLVYFIEWFLPQYTYSLYIFRIILPGLAINSSITVVAHNYYKVFEKSAEFFRKSIVALIVSAAFNIIAFQIFKTREAISVASIFALLVWYLHSRMGLRKICGANQKDTVYMLIMCLGFYLCTSIESPWLSGIIYFGFYTLISVIWLGHDWKRIKNICLHK